MVDAALFSSAKNDWETPANVLEAVRRIAPIGLDPCTTADNPVGAKKFYTPEHNGLELSWQGFGLCWVNPPYGRQIGPWAEKIATSAAWGVEIVALVPSRTDTKWFHRLMYACDTVLFWKGRLTFDGAPAPAPFPSVVCYLGHRPLRFFRAFDSFGLLNSSKGGWLG